MDSICRLGEAGRSLGCPRCRSVVYIVLLLVQSTPSGWASHWPVVKFQNMSPLKLSLHFIASKDQVKFIAELNPSTQVGQDTFVNHRFRVMSVDDASVGHVDVTITAGGVVAITKENGKLKAKWIQTVPKAEVGEKHKQFAQAKVQECLQNLDAAVASGNDPKAVNEDAEVFCRKFPAREVIVSKNEMSFQNWQKKMLPAWGKLRDQWQTQPRSLRNFTSTGLDVLRRNPEKGAPYGGLLSKEFYKSVGTMMDWYELNRLKAKPEEHGIFDPSVSSYESDTWVIHPPQELSKPLKLGIKQGLERWAGLPEDSLKFIAFYGPRLYRNNSILHKHVDIWETHVLSAIIAVGRRGLQRPWPIEILDHDGKLHSKQDFPGDVTFYESATCAHSREGSPLLGREVANIFVHFKPKEGWAPLEGSNLQGNAGKVREDAEL